MNEEIKSTFGNRLRVRVCGLVFQENKILMVKHRGLGQGYLWIPPGGGAEFGQNLEENLIREFKEETGLDISIGDFLFTFELLDHPLHAIEMFFSAEVTGGHLKVGYDPEYPEQDQIIQEVKFMTMKNIRSEAGFVHNIFNRCQSFEQLISLRGYFKFQK